jgi:ketosteroid isomerase-like protein
MASFTSDIELRSIKAEFSGELAYDSGDYSETVTSVKDGTRTAIRGDYLTIYKRGADKKWLIVQQVWTEAGASH